MTIDVVSMDSESCDLENLGAMADVSGGTVTRVSASELTSNFAGILANPILASQVGGVYFRGCRCRRGRGTRGENRAGGRAQGRGTVYLSWRQRKTCCGYHGMVYFRNRPRPAFCD